MIDARNGHGGLNVICGEDCGNAPKKAILKNFNIAFAGGDIGFMLEQTTDDIVWDIVGDKIVRGKDRFADEMKRMAGDKATEIRISNIITHGITASANYILKFGAKSIAFCHVYRFNSAAKTGKIKEITSFVIELPQERR